MTDEPITREEAMTDLPPDDEEHALPPAHLWMYSGSPHPRGVAEDVVRLAGYMDGGRTRQGPRRRRPA